MLDTNKSVKLCECGCGQPAPVARVTSSRDGWIKGEPRRFINGHNGRKWNVVDDTYVKTLTAEYIRLSQLVKVAEHNKLKAQVKLNDLLCSIKNSNPRTKDQTECA